MMHNWNNIASSLKHQQSGKAMIEKDMLILMMFKCDKVIALVQFQVGLDLLVKAKKQKYRTPRTFETECL